MINQLVSKYKILKQIGEGGHGLVYKAMDTTNGSIVAMKLMKSKFKDNEDYIGNFYKELLMSSSIHHKNIVQIIESHFDSNLNYVVTEFISGWSLLAIVRHFGRLPPLVALSICYEILRAADYLHLHDIIHADLTLPNILIDSDGRVKLTDFGLSVKTEMAPMINNLFGTPGYYSPEHISSVPLYFGSDLYCIGLLLYEMISGHRAIEFGHANEFLIEISNRMKQMPIKDLPIVDKWMHKSVVKILKSCWALPVNKRMQSAEEFFNLIGKILLKYEIEFPENLILEYLMIGQLVDRKIRIRKKNIFAGFKIYGPEDQELLQNSNRIICNKIA